MSDLLIITNSYDATTDLLLDRLEGSAIFRLNFDQMSMYQIRFNENGFSISAPDGRKICSQSILKAYWRKPFDAEPDTQEMKAPQYVRAELRYVLNEIVNLLWADHKIVLVEPFAERRTGKLLQLQHAREVFQVAPYEFVFNDRPEARRDAVAKSLSSEPVDEKVLYTTKVQSEDLDQQYPWFIQQYVSATHDVTAVYVRGQVFAFTLQRDFLGKSIDWRQHISPNQRWAAVSLPEGMSLAVSCYMQRLRLDFGRLDFLLDEQKKYWFCEVNPNGQFAWLDLHGEHGLLDAIASEISPSTERRPIPNQHPLNALCPANEMASPDVLTSYEKDCELLGVGIDFTPQELGPARRSKAALWHSDRLAQMAPELQEYATHELARINEAFNRLKEAATRGTSESLISEIDSIMGMVGTWSEDLKRLSRAGLDAPWALHSMEKLIQRGQIVLRRLAELKARIRRESPQASHALALTEQTIVTARKNITAMQGWIAKRRKG